MTAPLQAPLVPPSADSRPATEPLAVVLEVGHQPALMTLTGASRLLGVSPHVLAKRLPTQQFIPGGQRYVRQGDVLAILDEFGGPRHRVSTDKKPPINRDIHIRTGRERWGSAGASF